MRFAPALQPLPAGLLARFEQFSKTKFAASVAGAPALTLDELGLVLVSPPPETTRASLMESIRALDFDTLCPMASFEIVVAIEGETAASISREVIKRGVSAVSLHTAIARIAGLPASAIQGQLQLVSRALDGLRLPDGSVKIADLKAVTGAGAQSARQFLSGALEGWGMNSRLPIYLEAEAGKGKSTLFAEAVQRQLARNQGPLPLLLPLRLLQRGRGLSFGDIAASVGVTGLEVASLVDAIKAGLVAPMFDGLDEVAGRYDPSIVKEVLDLATNELWTKLARVFVSGRRTETAMLDRGRCDHCSIELPDTGEPAFRDYVAATVRGIVPGWPALYPRVPEPPLEIIELDDIAPTTKQTQAICEWIGCVFDSLGKERSLFFVQSLACIARTYQLAGNKPLVIESAAGARIQPAALYDVCVLAAALACIREQDKIEDIAKAAFDPSKQLDVLTWLALRAAAPESVRHSLPNPNELASDVFGVDTVNRNEEFTAIVRQLQKHALLLAGIDGSHRIGDWRPMFISEWVRGALLCRAWMLRHTLGQGGRAALIEEVFANSQQAALSFRHILPELIRNEVIEDADACGAVLRSAASGGSTEATAHFWELRAALGDDVGSVLGMPPAGLPECTDLSGFEASGLRLGVSFGANLAILAGAEFEQCSLDGCVWTQCDLTDAKFSGCDFVNVSIEFADGPVIFDNCVFRSTRIRNTRSRSAPTVLFVDCVFDEACLLEQTDPRRADAGYEEVFQFQGCETCVAVENLIRGDWAGKRPTSEGCLRVSRDEGADPATEVLRALIKTFFPLRSGSSGQRQARGYVRSSAIGRGVMPPGAPNADALVAMLSGIGFTSGGREGHIYAPWSGVAGGGADAMELRNEMLAFLTTRDLSPRVAQLRLKIKERFG